MAIAGVPDDKCRENVKALLQDRDLAATSIGALRAELCERLALPEGGLDAFREQVSALFQEEIVMKIQAEEAKKRKAASQEKKEKKKKAKKEAEGGDAKPPEADVSAPQSEPTPAPEAPQPIPPPEATETPAPEPVAAKAPEPVAAPAVPEKKVIKGPRSWGLSGSDDCTLRLWDLDSLTCIRVFEGHTTPVQTISVNWNDMQALSGCSESLRLWDLKHGGLLKTISDIPDGCATVQVTWEQMLALGGCGDGKLRIWNLKTGAQVKSWAAHPGGVWALQVNWQKKQAISGGDEHMKLWDLERWTCLQKCDNHPGGIMCLAMDWTNLRTLVGAGDASASLRLWNLDKPTPEHKNFLGHREAVSQIRASWDQQKAVTGGWDAMIRLWNVERNSCISASEVKFGRVRSMSVDWAQMQALCGSSSGSLHVVEIQNGQSLRQVEGHVGAVTVVEARFAS